MCTIIMREENSSARGSRRADVIESGLAVERKGHGRTAKMSLEELSSWH